MDNKDIASQAERYKREMMKLYGRRTSIYDDTKENMNPVGRANGARDAMLAEINSALNEEKNESPENSAAATKEDISEEHAPDSVPALARVREEANEERDPNTAEEAPAESDTLIPNDDNVDPNAPDDTAWAPHSQNDRNASSDIEDEYNVRYPEPDLSDLDTDEGTDMTENLTPPEYFSEESLGDSKGYIVVNVRTGNESSAIFNATVMITAVVDGNRIIFASGQTDHNGTTRRFELPVPNFSYSQSPDSKIRPYSLFDVTVTADGFFNARSVDVPVFADITSVQNFNMIPVPYMMRSSDETLTIFNQEPNFGDGRE